MKIDLAETPTVKEESPQRLNSPADSIPFGIEGIQTVIKNKRETTTLQNGVSLEHILHSEVLKYKNENIHLRNALKEAAKVNHQWRTYDEHRQAYVQKLLNIIKVLQQNSNLAKLSEIEKRLIASSSSPTRSCTTDSSRRLSANTEEVSVNSSSLESRDSSGLSSPTELESSLFRSMRYTRHRRSIYLDNFVRDKESTSSSDSLEMVSHSAVHEATFPNIQSKERLRSIEKSQSGDDAIYRKSYLASSNNKLKKASVYESKGARPKVVHNSSKIVEDRKDAKHRARSILASALPLTPPTSIPSSPVPQSCSCPSSTSLQNNSEDEKTRNNSHMKPSSLSSDSGNFSTTISLCHTGPTNLSLASGETSLGKNGIISCTSEKRNDFNSEPPDEVRSKTKLNEKILTITNNEYHQRILNCASVSVTPGSQSVLCSPCQLTSTATSRPSSPPGISLTTFATNNKGLGVPGTMLLALGSDNNTSGSVTSSVSSRSSHLPSVNQLVHSTWVKLMDKENNSFTSSAPWRTARAVPSHQLNSVKRSNQDDKSINYAQISTLSPTFHYCDSPQITIPYHSAPQGTTTTSPVFYTTSSHVCNGPETNIAQSETSISEINDDVKDKADMILKASKNISSAILGYECAHKIVHSKQSSWPQHIPIAPKTICNTISSFSNSTSPSCRESSPQKLKCYLICPSCQMLFPEEQRTEFVQHLPICVGPEYIDM